MRHYLPAKYSSWNSMRLDRALTVSDIAELHNRLYVGLAFKLTTTVHTRRRIIRYTNWATVQEIYPYHCIVEMYYDNGVSTIILRRDLPYVDLLIALKDKTIPFISTIDNFLEREVTTV